MARAIGALLAGNAMMLIYSRLDVVVEVARPCDLPTTKTASVLASEAAMKLAYVDLGVAILIESEVRSVFR